jgi:NAD(P)-dependent dehydrogenase (short-subunit alcohol dehydrogenase family)
MPDWLGLGGARAIVAGGAGTLGSAVITGLLEAGAEVAAIDLDREALAGLSDHVSVKHQADLSDRDAARIAVQQTRGQLGGVDVFVHCAGVNVRKPLDAYVPGEWERIMTVNVTSAFYTAVEAATTMRRQQHGRIVFFSSVSGRSAHKHHGPYAASKAAINQLMRVMAHEYAPDGITVNAVAPGYMETALTRDYLAEHPGAREALVELIPAGRFGMLDEVVGPVLFLCSRHAGFVTGHVLYVDGGRSLL